MDAKLIKVKVLVEEINGTILFVCAVCGAPMQVSLTNADTLAVNPNNIIYLNFYRTCKACGQNYELFVGEKGDVHDAPHRTN